MMDHLLILIAYPIVVYGHAGHDHGPTDATSTNSTSTSLNNGSPIPATSLAYAWGMCCMALLGAVIGGMIPLFAKPHDILKAKGADKLTKMESIWLSLLADVRGPRFISAALALSTGTLLYGSMALIIPGSITLIKPSLGIHTTLVVFALWLSGILLLAAIRWLSDVFDLSSVGPAEAPCPCHGPDKEAPACCDPEGQFNDAATKAEEHNLTQFGFLTMLAIAAHKIPEGIVTFISVIANPQFGTVLAFAILIHNIPEAIAISIPVFKATNSYLRAFFYPFCVCLFQLVGAGIGNAIVYSTGFSQLAQGLIYAPIGGMLMYIAVRGLWPSASLYESRMIQARKKGIKGQWTSHWFYVGVGIMFLSNALFAYA